MHTEGGGEESEGGDEGEEEGEEGEGDGTDYSAPSKVRAHVFAEALKLPAGSRGALPQEVKDLWKTMQTGPGAAKERHALRNAIIPKDATYGHVCGVDDMAYV